MRKVVYSLLIVLIVFSCKKNGQQGPQGPAGPSGTNYSGKGSIIGVISFYDTDGLEISVDTSAVVFIPNSTYSSTINSYGGYTLTNIPTGVYNVFVKCTAFSMANSVNVSIGTTTTYLREMSIAKIPTYGIWTLFLSPATNGYNISAPTPTVGENKAVCFYVSNSSNINPLIKSSYNFTKYSSAPNYLGYSAITLGTSYLNSNGFVSGQSVYVRAFPVPSFYASTTPNNLDMNKFSFTDTITGGNVNTACYLQGSYTSSFVCP